MNIQKTIKITIASAAMAAAATGASFAQNLLPNTTITPSATALGGVLITSQTNPFVAPPNNGNPSLYNGTMFSGVYNEGAANSLGGLTFVFQIANSASSTDPLDRVTDQSFTGFQTSAFYSTSSGTMVPTSAFRIGTASIGFRFETAANPGIGTLLPGATSDLLIIRTNAPSYTAGLAGISDGTTINTPSYAPASAVPEPATLATFALGGLGLLGLIARKTRRTGGAAA